MLCASSFIRKQWDRYGADLSSAAARRATTLGVGGLEWG